MSRLSSLLVKILFWFLLNLTIIAILLFVVLDFQTRLDIRGLLGKQTYDRLFAAALLISHDLSKESRDDWSKVLSRHSTSHNVNFMLIMDNGEVFKTFDAQAPELAKSRAEAILNRDFMKERLLEAKYTLSRSLDKKKETNTTHPNKKETYKDRHRHKPELVFQTKNPKLYWSGILLFINPENASKRSAGILYAVSDSYTGNGFFFNPIPLILTACVIILVSLLFWIPMVRHITGPLTRMARDTEEIAKGHFEVAKSESRADEIGRLSKSIHSMAIRLSAFVKGQKRFLGDVSHELGSPIARIQFGLGILENRLEGDNKERVTDILEDVDHLSKLVSELLAFSKAELKSKEIELETIELLPAVQIAVKREAPDDFSVKMDIDSSLKVQASSDLLIRAISNIIRNAVTYGYTNEGIHLTARQKRHQIEIEIRDFGQGVPEDVLDQLFEPFFRPDPSRTRDSGGVGLGLAIVKTCIETCQGSVIAHNAAPHGFTVIITLNEAAA